MHESDEVMRRATELPVLVVAAKSVHGNDEVMRRATKLRVDFFHLRNFKLNLQIISAKGISNLIFKLLLVQQYWCE